MQYLESTAGGQNSTGDPQKLRLIDCPQTRVKPENAKIHSLEYLVNRLNLIHFREGDIQIHFLQPDTGRRIFCHLIPQPCQGSRLECRWPQPEAINGQFKSWELDYMLVADGEKLLMATPELLDFNRLTICLQLPETCWEIGQRTEQRHACLNIDAQLAQNGAVFKGSLKDFSVSALHVAVTPKPPQSYDWIDPSLPVHLMLSVQSDPLYAGDCRILREAVQPSNRGYVLSPLHYQMHRFRPKAFRSTRQKLVPSPNVIFRHPLTSTMVHLKVEALSGTGFSVNEDPARCLLLPGMVIPELFLDIAGIFRFPCRVQVMHRRLTQDEKTIVCGLAILDMDAGNHARLLALLQQASDEKAYLSQPVDLDALWDFFFQTGFIYPQKYGFLQQHKAMVKETYQRLYSEAPTIARHFVYQDKGKILGHMAMVRFYENTWLIHHHAANTSVSNRSGLAVLNQIGRFINDSHNIYSVRMKHVMCYYRPDNRFPARVFGGAARHIGDASGCSVDHFAYFHHNSRTPQPLPKPWRLTEAGAQDLEALSTWYDLSSGGRMVQALDLLPETCGQENVAETFKRHGFKRQRRLYAIVRQSVPKAIIVVNKSDLGLNLSDLTNCIMVLILDSDGLPREVLDAALAKTASSFTQPEVPVMLYPVEYTRHQNISYEKQYALWILSMTHTDAYFTFLKRLIRFIAH